MDPDLDLVGADGLDRGEDRDLALVDGRAAGRRDGVDDVGDGDGAEEPAGVTGAGRERDLETLELRLDRGGVVEVADLTDLACPNFKVDCTFLP